MAGAEGLHVLSEDPLNAEPPSLEELIKYEVTPTRLVYSRNHGKIQDYEDEPGSSASRSDFRIRVEGEYPGMKDDFGFTIADLLQYMPTLHVIAVLHCAGNRRAKMVEKTGRDVEGLKWSEGTIANVKWSGAPLRLILSGSGVSENPDEWSGWHVWFGSHGVSETEEDNFSASIPLEKAMDPEGDVIIAYGMNEDTLRARHGFPMRVVIPGYTGTRWVKWLKTITVSREESPALYQQKDYKVLPENVDSLEKAEKEDWWSKMPPMQELELNSVVAVAEQGENTYGDISVKAKGYALSCCIVTRVQLSIDAGKIWTDAKITYQEGKWSWALWEATVEISEANVPFAEDAKTRTVTIWSRARDERGRVQEVDCKWNLRGVGFDGVGEKIIEV